MLRNLILLKNEKIQLRIIGNTKINYKNETRLYYGKIREAFNYWIRKPEIEKYILSVEQASMEFGADGAFFVLMLFNLLMVLISWVFYQATF